MLVSERSSLVSVLFTPHAQRERGKVIGRGVHILLPARASEQGNVIGSVRPYIYIYIYIYICVQIFFVIERTTRDLIYLKFEATDFFSKIISPSAGENSGDLA